MRKILVASAASLGFLAVAAAGSASAADLSPAPVMEVPGSAPIISWSGFYVGAVGTYGIGKSTADFSAPSFITSWKAVDVDLNGGLLGVTAGYNWQTQSNFVLGVEGDISFGRIGGDAFLPQNFGSPFNPNDTMGEFHQSWLATARVRLGWSSMAMGNPTLWYVTGGAAWSDGNRHIFNGTVNSVVSDNVHTGWTVGAGVEHKISNHWSLKAEALYVDLGKQSYQGSGSSVVTDVKLTDTLFRVGVNYGF
jgi:outer membrane immunogenic protein